MRTLSKKLKKYKNSFKSITYKNTVVIYFYDKNK